MTTQRPIAEQIKHDACKLPDLTDLKETRSRLMEALNKMRCAVVEIDVEVTLLENVAEYRAVRVMSTT